MTCELLNTLQDAGLSVELLPDDRISIAPTDRLTDDLRDLIRSHKTEIINALVEAANDQTITLGTRRPDGLTSALMAASVALDRKLEAAGYSLALPDDHQVPQPDSTVELQKDNPPPRKKKIDHFHVDSAWRVLSREYYAHHARCPQCQAAGQRYGERCDAGVELWQRAHVLVGE